MCIYIFHIYIYIYVYVYNFYVHFLICICIYIYICIFNLCWQLYKIRIAQEHKASFNAYCSFKELGTFGDGAGLVAYKYRQAASHAREKYRTWLKVKNNVKHGDALKGHPGWLINLYASFSKDAEEAVKAEEADADAASEDAKPPAPPPTQHASGSSPTPLQDTSPAQLQTTLPAPPSTQLHRKHQNTPESSPTPLQSTSPAPLQNASPAQVHHADSAAGANKAVDRKHPLFAFLQQTGGITSEGG